MRVVKRGFDELREVAAGSDHASPRPSGGPPRSEPADPGRW